MLRSARELLRAVEPMAIEAALEAERMRMESQGEQRRILELELQQARYEASLAERRYAACDPDNRLIAAQLEKSWETALRRVEACEARLEAARTPDPTPPKPDLRARRRPRGGMERAGSDHAHAASDSCARWSPTSSPTWTKPAREVVLTIHWRGGQHSQLRVRKPKSGEHGCRTPDEAFAVMRTMATPLVGRRHRGVTEPDGHAAPARGRPGPRTVSAPSRRVHGIPAYRSAEKNGEWLTQSRGRGGARGLAPLHPTADRRVSSLPSKSCPEAPYQILASDLAQRARHQGDRANG